MGLQAGRELAQLASTQISHMGRNLLPGGISQARWVQNTLEQIRQLTVRLGDLRDRTREIATAVSSSIAALTARVGVGAAAAGSAVSRFFGTALEILLTIGTRLETIPLILMRLDKNGNPIPLKPGGPPTET